MAFLDGIKNFLGFKNHPNEEEQALLAYAQINFKVVVIEFSDNVESTSGEIITNLMKNQEGINISYFDEPFSKSFLNLESRTLFDFIDKGQDILFKTGADVVVWGYRENDKIRLNFQNSEQYEKNDTTFISMLDSLYIPAHLLQNPDTFPQAVSNLIYGGIVSAINPSSKEGKIKRKYLLKKVIDRLSRDNSAKSVAIDYMPFIMNFLGIIYLSYCCDKNDDKDFKITKNLFDTAIKHQDLIKSPIHLGCIYNHLGQLYNCSLESGAKKSNNHFKGAITNYRQAQKYLSKYNYPYDYGYISYKLSHLFFSYWRQKEDLQALRDAVFQLREAEKIYTYALFPEFWSSIQGEIGQMLSVLGSLTKSEDISELAIASFKNQQKVITEKRDPQLWASIQENIGDIYYRLGKSSYDKALLEEALEYFHDALYIFENMEDKETIQKLTISIAKTSQILNSI